MSVLRAGPEKGRDHSRTTCNAELAEQNGAFSAGSASSALIVAWMTRDLSVANASASPRNRGVDLARTIVGLVSEPSWIT
jgi:hypothetical protein